MASTDSMISLQPYGMLRETALYIERPADTKLRDQLINGVHCIVTASRQAGKSSLAGRTARELKKRGITCSLLDLTLLPTTSPREWFQQLTKFLADDLKWQPAQYRALWQQHQGEDYRALWLDFLRTAASQAKHELVLLFDEVDCLLSPSLKLDAFSEALHEFTATLPPQSGKFSVAIAFFGVFQTSGQLLGQTGGSAFGNLIKDFERIYLRRFTEKEILIFRPALDKSSDPDALLKAVYRWTAGQPHLTHRLVYELKTQSHLQEGTAGAVVDDLVQQLYLDPGRISDDFLESAKERIRVLGRTPGSDTQIQLALRLYRRVLGGESIAIDLNSPLQQELGLLGLCHNEKGILAPLCLIVQKVFNLTWLEKQLTTTWFDTAFEKWKSSNENSPARRDAKLLLSGWMLADAQAYLDQQERISPEERDFVSRSLSRVNRRERAYFASFVLAVFAFVLAIALLLIYADNLLLRTKMLEVQLSEKIAQQKLADSERRSKSLEADLADSKNREASTASELRDLIKINREQQMLAELDQKELQEQQNKIDELLSKVKDADDAQGEIKRLKLLAANLNKRLAIVAQDKEQLAKQLAVLQSEKPVTKVIVPEKVVVPEPPRQTLAADYTSTFPHTTAVDAVAILPDDNLMVSGTDAGLVSFWSVLTQKIRSSIKVHAGHVNSIVISADGRRAASAGRDGMVVVFDAKTGATVKQQLAHPGGANALAFSADGQWLLSGGEDGTAKLWRASNGDSMAELTGHKGPVSAVAFSQDGSTAITGGADKTARVWKLRDGKPASTAPVVLQGHSKWVSFVWLSAKGTRALVGTEDSRSYLWLIDGKKPRSSNLGMLRQRFSMFLTDQKKRESKGAILSMMQSGDTTYFASTDSHGVVWVWEAFTGNPVQELAHEDNGEKQMLDNAAAFSPDGSYVATASADKIVRIWRLKKRPMKLPE